MAYYIGLDIGGTKCAAVLGKIANTSSLPEIVKKESFATENLPPDTVFDRFLHFIEKTAEEYSVQAVGIGCGGPLNSETGEILCPAGLPLWKNVKITEYFEQKFGIKTRLMNDANACAVAEWKFGAGKGAKNMAFLTFGTGLGAGLILNGKLYSGANDNAGEIGHVRLTKSGPLGYYKYGSCEGYCSGAGIKRLAEIMGNKERYKNGYAALLSKIGEENLSAKTIAEQAKNGDKFCLAVYKKSGEMLGKTLSILIDVLNPELIVIGGVYMRAEELLYPYALKEMEKESLANALSAVRIVPAKLSENVGDIAALAVAAGGY